MPEIMTTKELAKYLKLHEITVCKYAAEGKIPALALEGSGGLTKMPSTSGSGKGHPR